MIIRLFQMMTLIIVLSMAYVYLEGVAALTEPSPLYVCRLPDNPWLAPGEIEQAHDRCSWHVWNTTWKGAP